MKIDTRTVSAYLQQADVPQPIIATMDCVTLVSTLRNPHVLHFANGRPKPIPLNLTNRRALVALYGDDDSGWAGKPIEVYVDPNVNDSKGNRVGGIRLRLPAVKPQSQPAAKPNEPLIGTQEIHLMVMDCYRTAKTDARLDACYKRSQQYRFEHWQVEEQYALRLERKKAIAATPPVPVNGKATQAARR